MSDPNDPTPNIDRRAPRPVPVSKTLAYGYGGTLLVSTIDWIEKCRFIDPSTHHGFWSWVPPDNALIAEWAFLLMPAVHLIAKIIMKRLQKLAGEDE